MGIFSNKLTEMCIDATVTSFCIVALWITTDAQALYFGIKNNLKNY